MKDTTFKFRLSEEELLMLKGKAAASGMSTAEFILTCCKAKRVSGYVPTQPKQIAGQMTLDDLLK